MRQVYKIQLKDETIADTENPDRLAPNKRIFKAVAGDSQRKGELFGIVSMSTPRDVLRVYRLTLSSVNRQTFSSLKTAISMTMTKNRVTLVERMV